MSLIVPMSLVSVVDIQANHFRTKFVFGGNVSEHASGFRAKPRHRRGTDKNHRYSFVLGDSLRCVNNHQKGKLTGGAGNRDGKAEGISRLRIFLAIYDQNVFLPGWNLAW